MAAKKITRKESGLITSPFEVVSGVVRVTDPCYDPTTWCSAEVKKVKNGKWNASVRKSNEQMWGERCAELFVWHSDHKQEEVFNGMKRVEIKEEIGVDSGQAGVFDAKFYKDDKSVKGVERIGNHAPICADEPWYSICCDRTLSDQSWGTIPYGAVSSSGFGDGGYTGYKYLNSKGEVVGIKIVFID